MKKNFKFYAIAWAIMLVVFNVVAIVSPGWVTIEKLTPSFWIGYAFVTAAFIGQMICTWIAFKDNNAKKQFYNISLFTTSYAGLIATFVVGVICMLISLLPYWVAAIICSIVLALNIVSVIKAKIAVELVSAVDEKIEQKTSFIYLMRDESESLLARASSDEIKIICKKVRDAFKYSDPMSADILTEIEDEIQAHFEKMSQAVRDGKADIADAEKETVMSLISERNTKCKSAK